jgi:hypothetical protein
VIHWTDGVDSQIGIQALGVGNVLRLDPDAARRIADELKRHVTLVKRTAAELAPEPDDFSGPDARLTPHQTEHVVFGQPHTDLPKSVGQQPKGTRR